MLLKKLSVVAMVGIVSVSVMTGCSSVENVEQDGNNVKIELTSGEVLDYSENDGVAIVKCKTAIQSNAEKTVKSNFMKVCEIAKQLPKEVTELQYWAVSLNDSDEEEKIFSCTIEGESLELVKEGKVLFNDLAAISSKCSELWILEQFADIPEIVWPDNTDTQSDKADDSESKDNKPDKQINQNNKNNDKNQSNGSGIKDSFNQGIQDAINGKDSNPPKDNNANDDDSNSNYNPEADTNGDGTNDHYDDYDDSPNEYIEPTPGNTAE